MNWKNLEKSMCPKCNGLLFDKTLIIVCSKCDFKIKPQRLQEILSNTIRKRLEYRPISEEENLEALNNFGMDEMTEDFEDSPFADRQ